MSLIVSAKDVPAGRLTLFKTAVTTEPTALNVNFVSAIDKDSQHDHRQRDPGDQIECENTADHLVSAATAATTFQIDSATSGTARCAARLGIFVGVMPRRADFAPDQQTNHNHNQRQTDGGTNVHRKLPATTDLSNDNSNYLANGSIFASRTAALPGVLVPVSAPEQQQGHQKYGDQDQSDNRDCVHVGVSFLTKLSTQDQKTVARFCVPRSFRKKAAVGKVQA